jgi:hypothetical protein
MGDINAMQHQDNRFASLESDHVWVVGKSLRDDFNSPGDWARPAGMLETKNITAKNIATLTLVTSFLLNGLRAENSKMNVLSCAFSITDEGQMPT